MEVLLCQWQGVPDGSLVSVRAGHLRRQAPVEAGRTLKFSSEVAGSRELQVEILAVIGRAKLSLAPSTERYSLGFETGKLAEGEESMRCEVQVHQSLSPKRPCESAPHLHGGDKPEVAEVKQSLERSRSQHSDHSRRHETALSAQKYMEHHDLVRVLQVVMKATVSLRPEDPFSHLAQQLMLEATERGKGKTGSSLPEEVLQADGDVSPQEQQQRPLLVEQVKQQEASRNKKWRQQEGAAAQVKQQQEQEEQQVEQVKQQAQQEEKQQQQPQQQQRQHQEQQERQQKDPQQRAQELKQDAQTQTKQQQQLERQQTEQQQLEQLEQPAEPQQLGLSDAQTQTEQPGLQHQRTPEQADKATPTAEQPPEQPQTQSQQEETPTQQQQKEQQPQTTNSNQHQTTTTTNSKQHQPTTVRNNNQQQETTTTTDNQKQATTNCTSNNQQQQQPTTTTTNNINQEQQQQQTAKAEHAASCPWASDDGLAPEQLQRPLPAALSDCGSQVPSRQTSHSSVRPSPTRAQHAMEVRPSPTRAQNAMESLMLHNWIFSELQIDGEAGADDEVTGDALLPALARALAEGRANSPSEVLSEAMLLLVLLL
ncbi:unnamed protein product [Polarella glacialis]|uniref:Uncharacterized protein n=1 Tax=Polarella glacialis TaxID=89957 RepID=A0A813GGG4_POLGL|nr:unnamed protein product [Polarella glacialis]